MLRHPRPVLSPLRPARPASSWFGIPELLGRRDHLRAWTAGTTALLLAMGAEWIDLLLHRQPGA